MTLALGVSAGAYVLARRLATDRRFAFGTLALLGGKFLNIVWLDPVMGVVGAVLVAQWAVSLIKQSGRVLLDADMDAPVVEEVREVVAEKLPSAAITDLHVWRAGKGRYACILGLVTDQPLTPAVVRGYLSVHEELVHVTVEIAKADAPATVFFPNNQHPDGKYLIDPTKSSRARRLF